MSLAKRNIDKGPGWVDYEIQVVGEPPSPSIATRRFEQIQRDMAIERAINGFVREHRREGITRGDVADIYIHTKEGMIKGVTSYIIKVNYDPSKGPSILRGNYQI